MSLDGQEINYTPEKNDYIVNVTCDKAGEAYWDNESWGLMLKNFEKGIKCSVDFETKYLTNYIKYLANTSDELLVDETEDQNIRYVGANPNNYVLFNNELWRIVGVMNNVQNEQNESESRVKLVRASSIGSYSWNLKEDGTYGGTWEDSSLRQLLNETYYNSGIATYYNKSSSNSEVISTIIIDFTEIGLSEEARNQIDIASWNYAAIDESVVINSDYTSKKYLSYSNVGLVDIVDVEYSIKGGENISRSECLNFSSRYYYWQENPECKTTNYFSLSDQRTITAKKSLTARCIATAIGTCLNRDVRKDTFPSVYLKSDIYYVSGTGSNMDPFIIK